MRVIIDLTNSPHVPFFAPLVRRLEAAGHDVVVTGRQFAQTVELARLHGLDMQVIGAHGGASRAGKARAAAHRVTALAGFAMHLHRRERFDVALSHGSTDLPMVCRLLGVPHVTMFDYEWAATMHHLNCRLSWRVMTPDAIPPERLQPYGAAGKLVQYAGLKEEYYLHDAQLDGSARTALGIDDDALLAVMRPPPELALYHRGRQNDLFDAVIDRIRGMGDAAVVVLPRTAAQRDALLQRHAGSREVIVPEHAIDAQSLVAASDLVVSAGGTMNREAAALGVPVYTVFAGRRGAVDEELVRSGRMRELSTADDVVLERASARSDAHPPRQLRDPQELLDLAFAGLPAAGRTAVGGRSAR